MKTTTISQFIPIIIIVLLLSWSKEFVNISHTILGKILALSVVIFYTHLDKYLGVIICLFVIIYYQSDFVENMLNTDDLMNTLVENFEASKKEKTNVTEESPEIEDIQNITPKSAELQKIMSKVDDVYKPEIESKSVNVEGFDVVKNFREENCKDNSLYHKQMKVNPEMVSHIYPELKFKNSECNNACDNNCEFSIIENRLKNEKELFSKCSRDEKI
jgi:hypothetical protein